MILQIGGTRVSFPRRGRRPFVLDCDSSYSSRQTQHQRGTRWFSAEEVLAGEPAELFFIILRKKVSVFKELSFNFA